MLILIWLSIEWLARSLSDDYSTNILVLIDLKSAFFHIPLKGVH